MNLNARKGFISERKRGDMTLSVAKGLTLLELMVVLGIAALLGALSTPALYNFLASGYFTNSVEVFVHTLRTAQSYSVSGRDDSAWGVHFEPGKAVLFKGTDFAARDASFDTQTPLPTAVVVTGWSDLYFNRLRGTPSQKLDLTVAALGRTGRIKMNLEGRINRP